ncbi:ribonuclease kappa-A [Drosophila eugracilis]|uniref:ribonuclease kappa-A n=1 Tax=Drosophila eugracilis TaxID=29029 RepID=UPI0007E60D37|nr:ribonuclease kappa-A [Drosophila eugracilis]
MVCGRKCCFFCLFMSSWAFVMLNLLGIFFYIHSLILMESLPIPHHFNSQREFEEQADEAYFLLAIRCFVTAIVYLAFVFIAIAVIRHENKKRKRLYKRGHRR